ncbi:MAG: HD domain-containing protein [Desulfobulbaceae bacterium]|nr:HD domain-containing protein [Desulfobulbaceae bacterium]
MKTGITISDIEDGQTVKGVFLLKEMTRAETRAGKPYLTLKIMDKTGELTGRIWDEADRWEKECTPGQAVSIQAQSQTYKGNLQLIITAVEKIPEDDVDLTMFIPSTSCNVEEMAEELKSFAKSTENPYIKKLLLKFINDTEFFEKFKKAPAAKSMHHAYLGGLLEHTLRVCRLADKVSSLYPSINRSLLMAGALLHDIGKVEELAVTSSLFDYSDEGRLMGHMVLGVEMVQERIRKIKDFPAELAVRIKHLILSHHGRHEFGAPTLPMLHEAFILNFLDDLDAKINYMERLSAQVPPDEYKWSDYQRNMERFLFLSGHPQQPCEDESGQPLKKKEKAEPKIKQPTLF